MKRGRVNQTSRPPARWLVAALIFALLAAGCQGSTRPVVKIGLIAPFEELYRDDGYEALHAVRLALAQRNAAGGVAGRQAALAAHNDNGRADEAQLQAVKMAVDPDVLGVVAPLQPASWPAGATLSQHAVPWVSLAELTSQQLAGGVGLALSPQRLGAAAIEALAATDATSALVFSEWPEALAGAQSAGAAAGLAVRGLPLAAAQSVQPAPGEGVVWLGDAEEGARLATAYGPGVSLIGGSALGAHIFVGRAGDASAEAAWLSPAPAADDLPPAFVESYRALAGVDPGPQAALAYDAANLLLDAIDRAGARGSRLDRESVQKALDELAAQGWQGVSGQMRWSNCGSGSGCGQRNDTQTFLHSTR